jgi:hypothetical protein
MLGRICSHANRSWHLVVMDFLGVLQLVLFDQVSVESLRAVELLKKGLAVFGRRHSSFVRP